MADIIPFKRPNICPCCNRPMTSSGYGLTKRQAELLDYLNKRVNGDGVCPTFQEMADYMGYKTKSPVFRLVEALTERGHIIRLPNRVRAIKVII